MLLSVGVHVSSMRSDWVCTGVMQVLRHGLHRVMCGTVVRLCRACCCICVLAVARWVRCLLAAPVD